MRRLALFFMFFVWVSLTSAQNMEETIDKLLQQQLLKKSQVKDFQRFVREVDHYRGDEGSQLAYLQALFLMEFKKLTGHYHSPFAFINISETQISDAERSELSAELAIYLTKLKASELINEPQEEIFRKRVDDNEYLLVYQLLLAIAEKVGLDEEMASERLEPFAAKLQQASICTGNNCQMLLEAIDQSKLENPIDFLNYCDRSVLFDLRQYPDEPDEYLERIHRETAALMDELEFTEFQYEIRLDSMLSDNDDQFFDVVVSIRSNGKEYKHKSFYAPVDKYYENSGIGMDYLGKIDNQEYYNIFNKILADRHSAYRLHSVEVMEGNTIDHSRYGIIVLTKEQADLLHQGGSYFRVSYENFRNNLTSDRIDQAILEYRQLGLFDHLSEEEIRAGVKKVSEQENRNLNEVLLCFPNIIHSFDMELTNVDDPYSELVTEYANISHSAFQPVDIADDFDIEKKKKCTIQFKVNNKVCTKQFRIDRDWIDPDFFGFMDQVVSELGLNGKFYSLYEGGQGANIIYLTAEQYQYLRANKLVVFADEWEGEE